jgi:hypothetical protein
MSERRMSKQERVEARRRSLQEQEHRNYIEAQLAELEKQPGGAGGAELEKLGLTVAPISPATAFIMERLKGVSLEDPLFDSKYKQAIVDLVASDVPLHPRTRALLAGDLYRLYFPNSARDRRAKRQLESAMIEDQKQYLLSTGMTAAEAVQMIAKERGIKPAALHKRVNRTKT